MGLISGLIKAGSDAGTNKDYQSGFGDPNSRHSQAYDPNAKNYGGQPGGAEAYANEMRLRQGGADSRHAPTANYGESQALGNQAALARGGQQQATNLIMNRATGATPSIAGQQSQADFQRLQNQSRLDNQMLQQNAQQQSQQALAANAAQASSARGAAGVALAGQQAANNTANAQGAIGRSTAQASQNMGMANANAAQNISNQAQVNAANERMQAEQAALGGYSTIRSGDQTAQDAAAGRAQFNANQQLASRNANDARAMGYEGLLARANETQLNANMQDQGIKANSYNAAMGHNAATSQANATRQGQKSDGLADDVGGFFDSAIGGVMGVLSDSRAKQQALINQGRQEGVALAQGGRGAPSEDADPAALDDRFQQNEEYRRSHPPPNQYERFDSVDDPSPQQDPVAQWERSFGSSDRAVADARQHDNMVEGQKIRDGFARDARGPAKQRSNPLIAGLGRGFFESDERAKERAYQEGMQAGIDDTLEATGTEYKHVFGRQAASGGAKKLEVTRPETADSRFERGQEPAFEHAPAVHELPPPKRQAGPDDAVEFSAQRPAHPYQEGPVHEAPYSRGPSLSEQMSMEDLSRGSADEAQAREYAQRYMTKPALASGGAARKTTGATHSAPGRKRSMESDERAKTKGVDKGPVADANRAMRGEPYAYKPEHTPPNEKPGQPHYGFMAQNLEKSPVSKVAVEEGPDGMKRVDRDRMLQVVAAGVADLQRQQDETRLALRKGGRR
jgi:hypothetical protein